MSNSAKSPANRLISKARSRRSDASYLWTCYSHKIDADLILESHEELIHWLIFLEFNSQVESFWIPAGDEIYSDSLGGPPIRPDAIVIDPAGQREWHDVRVGVVDKDNLSSKLIASSRVAAACGATYRIYDNSDLIPHMYKIAPLLRLCSFVLLCRFVKQTESVEAAVLTYAKDRQHGKFIDVLNNFRYLDQTIVISALGRLYIRGALNIEINEQAPTLTTSWHCNETN
ncbi:hypothetical protein [Pseudomonas azerbaijanoccidentalis]